MSLAQLSPNPSRKKAYLSPFALASQLTDEATALEEEDIPLINPLEGLSQLAEAISRTLVSYKESKGNKSSKLVKCVNFYEQARSARMSIFSQACIWIYITIFIVRINVLTING